MSRIRLSCKKDRTTLTPSYFATIEGDDTTYHLTAVQDILVERPIGTYLVEITYKERSYTESVEITQDQQEEQTLLVQKNPKLWFCHVAFFILLITLLLLTNLLASPFILNLATILLVVAVVGLLVVRKKLPPLTLTRKE